MRGVILVGGADVGIGDELGYLMPSSLRGKPNYLGIPLTPQGLDNLFVKDELFVSKKTSQNYLTNASAGQCTVPKYNQLSS